MEKRYFAINAGYSKVLHKGTNWYYCCGSAETTVASVRRWFTEKYTWLDLYSVKEITFEEYRKGRNQNV